MGEMGRRQRVGLMVLVLTLVRCGPGDGTTLDEQGRPPDHSFAPGLGSRLGAAVLSPTYTSIAENFFEPFCSECHSGASPSKGLDLTQEAAYAEMLGVSSLQARSLLLINPGNPNDSYLIIKLVGGPRMIGRRMPRGRPTRPESEVEVVRAWIEAGAPRN